MEALQSGVFRSDIPSKFALDVDTFNAVCSSRR